MKHGSSEVQSERPAGVGGKDFVGSSLQDFKAI